MAVTSETIGRLAGRMTDVSRALEEVRNDFHSKYRQIGEEWKDQHYEKLGELIRKNDLSMRVTQEKAEAVSKWLYELQEKLERYEKYRIWVE